MFSPPENLAVFESAGPPSSVAQGRFGVQTLPKTLYGSCLFPDELQEKGEDSLESSPVLLCSEKIDYQVVWKLFTVRKLLCLPRWLPPPLARSDSPWLSSS